MIKTQGEYKMAAKKTDKTVEKNPASDKKAALETVISRIERECGKGSIMRLGENANMNVSAVSTGSLSLDFALGVEEFPEEESPRSTVLSPQVRPLLRSTL